MHVVHDASIGGRGKRIQEQRTRAGLSQVRQTDAPTAYRLEFYLNVAISYVAISVVGFKMSWTARSRTPGGCGPAGVASPMSDGMNRDGRIDMHTTQIADDDRDSGTNLCLVREFSTVATPSAACAIQRSQVTSTSLTVSFRRWPCGMCGR